MAEAVTRAEEAIRAVTPAEVVVPVVGKCFCV